MHDVTRRPALRLATLAAIAALAGCANAAPDDANATGAPLSTEQPANGRGGGVANRQSKGPAGSAIAYHGGPVMLGTTGVYYIWYGNWANDTATTILTELAQNLGGSPYWNINTSYDDGAGNHISNSLAYKGSTTDAYSQGTSLTDAQVLAVVTSAIESGGLVPDSNATYYVLTSADVSQGGFCSSYCGWHDHATVSVGGASYDVKYAFVGDPSKCMSACAAQKTGPNGNAAADAMASVIAHELDEMATDEDLNAWYDKRGQENADKCAWTFGTTYTTSNGAKANMKLGTRDYLIQQNWVNASTGYCALSY